MTERPSFITGGLKTAQAFQKALCSKNMTNESILLGHFIKPQTHISEEWLILFNLRKSFANVLDSNLS